MFEYYISHILITALQESVCDRLREPKIIIL